MRRLPIYWQVFFILAAYAAILAAFTGDVGFCVDDWWMLSFPYWNGYWQGLQEYVKDMKRPLEAVYVVTLFTLFGFHKAAWFFCAMLELAAACFFMGMCLLRAFPERPGFVAAAMLFGFFIPSASSLTYLTHMDNMWLCMLLYWASVAAFQRWAECSPSWVGLAAPIALYYLATLAYDAANLLIFLVPLFVAPVLERHGAKLFDPRLWLKLCCGLIAGFSLLLVTKMTVFGGGLVSLKHVIPSPELIWSYAQTFPAYVVAPFVNLTTNGISWALAVLIVIATGLVVAWNKSADPSADASTRAVVVPFSVYVGLWVLGLIVLGSLPYLMAGYGATVGFFGQGRIYLVAGFGVAILFGAAATAFRSGWPARISRSAAVACIMAMVLFHADLRRDHQAAHEIREEVWKSLRSQAPSVAPGTVFLFLDLQSYIGNRAVVFGGVYGLKDFIKIFYGRRDVDAYFLYSGDERQADPGTAKATVSPAGIVPRGRPAGEPIPLDRVLIFKKDGSRLKLLDSLDSTDKSLLIQWDKIDAIRSNHSLIDMRRG